MKAVILERFGGPENLQFKDSADPKPAVGEILIRVRACALNHLDLWVREGIPAYKIQTPHILGCDIAGEVAGGDFSSVGLKTGQRALVAPGKSCGQCEFCAQGQENHCREYHIIGADGGAGGYAEFVSVPAQNVFPIPDSFSFEQAAAIPLTFLTAWHMLISQAKLRPGQTVLVLGAGSGVGVAAIQVAAAAGARIIAASTSEKKLDAAKKLGAHEVIHTPPDDLYRKVVSLTDREGVDVVFEHIGPAVFDKAVKSLKPGGILVTCGATTGPIIELDLRYVFSRELRIHGAKMGTLAEFHELMRLIRAGAFKPVVDSVFPLHEARKAHEHLAGGKQFGKVVLKI